MDFSRITNWLRRHPIVARVLLVAATTTAALRITLSLPEAHDNPVFLFCVAAVAASAWWGGFYAGAAALLVTIAETMYYVVPPVGSFRVSETADVVRLVNFFGLSFIAVIALSRLRENQQRTRALLEQEQATRLAEERTRQELQESERRFRGTFNQAAVGIAHVGLDGKWLRVNEKLCDIVGYSREELVSRTFQDITHPDDVAADLEQYQRLQRGEIDHYSIEKRYHHKAGHLVWVNLTVSLARDEGGNPKYAISVIEDISQRHMTEQAAHESDERLRNAYRANGMWSWELDPTTNTITRSASQHEPELAFEGKREETVATWFERMHPDDRKEVRARLARVLTRATDEYEIEFRTRFAGGSYHWVFARGTLIHRPEGVVLSGIASDVTDRHEKEAKLRYLSAIVESSDAAIIGKDLKGMITSWNRGAERLYGYRAEEVIGRPISLLIPEHNQHDKELPELLERLTWGEHIEDYETVRRHKDGRLIEVSLKLSPIQDERGGCIIGASSIARDITKLKQAERALRESESRFRSLYENAAVGIEQVALDGTLLTVNEALCRMLGYSEEQLLARTFEDITHPEDQQREAVLLNELFAGQRSSYTIEKRYLRSDGAPLWVTVTSALVRDAAGEPSYRISVVEDIDNRKRAEEALRTSEARFREVTENIPQLVWTANALGRTDFVSKRWVEYTGIDVGATAGDGWLELIHPDDRTVAAEAWERANRSGSEYTVEYRLRRVDGEYRWHFSHAIPIKDERGNVLRWFGTTTDIVDQKKAQQALIQSEKLASVGRMAATIAHEINNPLETVMNSVYLAWSDPAISPQARQQLDVAEQELERVAHITRQTLGFYRESGRAVNLALAELVNDVLDIYEPRLRNKNISVERDFEPVRICAVPGEIKQIVSNLVANGIDAMERGGKLYVRAGVLPGANGRGLVRLTIADTGCGIPPELARRIYEPFFTTKESIGTGLGLWVSSELVKKHGGWIRMRSRSGRGTVFAIQFPKAEEPCDR